MELSEIAKQLFGIYSDISAEIGAVLAYGFVILLVVAIIVFVNVRSNAKMRAAQSETFRTINDMVRTQSERENRATEEAKRLNDALLKQSHDYTQALHEQAQRINTLESTLPLYIQEIEDLKSNREVLLDALQKERQQHREDQRHAEERHITEITEIKNKFDQTVAMANEFKMELAEVKAELRAREVERNQYREENKRANQIVSELVSMQNSIDKLAKVIIDEFSKLGNFASIIPVADTGAGGGVSSGGTGQRRISGRYERGGDTGE